ncbi:peptidoglycan-binding protein [uncultured Flavonifractor sp.]|uniref:peptidoglycan-binding protein n=1 Tax=uncultured Flavonifractor sp. TaxID=1193534 RepID=UPI0026142E2F|nr:peptidoglycan-binding protein [uncultured Flavonifractor sp.]
MPESLPITPYVPQYITVHLGPPGSDAENVTVSFPEYVKNVASSEIYPTWETAALQANILAIISFALNRVYTEFYPSRGYPFNITSSTAYDQKFIKGRNIFENISQLVDEMFNSYIRRIGFVEPLAAKFCNGTTVTCDGLSQWGSQAMAEQGADYMTILRSYYGDNIELVTNAPVRGIRYSYPGYPIRRGDSGEAVQRIQVMLNRISRDYPAIPKVYPVDGVFGPATENAVKKFQEIFDLTPDGIVGNSTWYKMVFLYVGVLDLAELISQGQTYYPGGSGQPFPSVLSEGARGDSVRTIQYVLSVVSEFYSNIPRVAIDGIYGPATKNAVIAVQRMAGLPQDGIMGPQTWAALYRMYAGIVDTVETYTNVIPEQFRPDLPESQATGLTQYPGQPMTLGSADERGAAS